ncbi:MAG: hypothetical protein ACTJGR_10865 [Pauljensenia sp.]
MSDKEVPTPGNQPTTHPDLDDEVATEGVQPKVRPNFGDEVSTVGDQPGTALADEEIPGNPGNPVDQ